MNGEQLMLERSSDQFTILLSKIQTFLNVMGNFDRDQSIIGSLNVTVYTWAYWIKLVMPYAALILGVIVGVRLALKLIKRFSR